MNAPVIAVIEGGPAGAMAAARLAGVGRKAIVIDEKLAWEKPCGGGVTRKALAEFPVLAEAEVERNWIRGCELISPSGRRTYFRLDQSIAIFSRKVLNGLLLDCAERAGAEIVRDRALRIEGGPGQWLVHTGAGEIKANYVVIAAGARSQLRSQFTSALSSADLMITAGYYIPETSENIQIQFLPKIEGYIWVFPRSDHSSVGICGQMETISGAELRKLLAAFIADHRLNLEGATFYGHVLPALRRHTLKQNRFQGEGWALVGDAAGFVDPITGEGLYYALRSGELLARAILAGKPEQYRLSVCQDFLPELIAAAKVSQRFYTGSFLGAPVTDRMVQLTNVSEHFRDLMRDIFSGSQGYCGMRWRAYRAFAHAVLEMAHGTGRRNNKVEADMAARS